MRRILDVSLAILFAVCFVAGAAFAAEASSPLPGLEISWPKLIVAVLGLLGLLERVRDWILRYRQHVALVYQIVEEISASGSPEIAEAGAIVKRRLKGEIGTASKVLQDQALFNAAQAEANNGTAFGTASKTLKRQIGRVVLRTLLRLIPVVGRFF